MTVYANKPAFNVREKLKELEKPSGIAGEAMLRAETPQEQFNLIGAGRRNLIINGNAQISQRGDYSSATTVVNQTLYVDRWFADVNISSTFQHTDVDIEDMPTKCKAMKYVATTSGTNYMGTRQKVESPSQYEGRTFTYSAYVRSNHASARLTTYMAGSAQVEYSTAHSGNGQWERLSTTFTVKSGVTVWYLDVFLATQGLGVVDISTGDYFEVTGIQLELGRVATPFEHRSYGEELALCQRYFYRIGSGSSSDILGMGGNLGTTTAYFSGTYPVEMRDTPTITVNNPAYFRCHTPNGSSLVATAFGAGSENTNKLWFLSFTLPSSQPAGAANLCFTSNNASGYGIVSMNAEL